MRKIQAEQTEVACEIQQLEECQITIFKYLNSVSVWLSVTKVYTSVSVTSTSVCTSDLFLWVLVELVSDFLQHFFSLQKAHHCPL